MVSKPKLLFIFSNDFGEVVNANLFVQNQAFSAYYALPSRLSKYNDLEYVYALSYTDISDIVRHIDNIQPDIIFLCSGFLFSINRILTPEVLVALKHHINKKGIPLITTDPWLKFWKTNPGATFSLSSPSDASQRKELEKNLQQLQCFLDETFSDTPHLYSMPFQTDIVPSYSFYNPQCGLVGTKPPLPSDHMKDNWLFVISNEDWNLQVSTHKELFAQALTDRLVEVLSNEQNSVTFIGPEAIGPLFDTFFAQNDRFTFLPFCSFTRFQDIMASAKILIYWNILSSTLLYYIYLQKPHLFLSVGHQALLSGQLYEHFVKHVYQGIRPIILSVFDPFAIDVNDITEQFNLAARYIPLIEKYSASLSPEDIVERILSQ